VTNFPIAIFCYNRPEHLKRTVDSLLANPEAKEMVVHFFSDAAKSDSDAQNVKAVRNYIKTVKGFASIHTHEASENLGLSKSIIGGVTEILKTSEGIIILEDDMECRPFFLSYMLGGLTKYASDKRVASIHAYSYPIENLPESFFLKGADCWGWATWPRAWQFFEEDGNSLMNALKKKSLLKRFNYENSYPYQRMLERQIKGENQSWAVRWYASALLNDMLTLYPGRSLIRNLGNDDSGTHGANTGIYEPLLATSLPGLPNKVEESNAGYRAFVRFFKKSRRRAILEKLGLKRLF